jgi:tetratricopeptide (TPR) repeat protein
MLAGFMLTILCAVCTVCAAAQIDEAAYGNYMAAAAELTRRDDHAGAVSQLLAAVKNAESFGANDLRLASALHTLGRARRALHDYVPAEASYLRALGILDQARGDVRERIAAVLNGLGEISLLRSRYDAAEGYFEEELAVLEQIGGPHHPSVAHALSNNLAAIYRFQARHADVEATYRRALAILDKSVPPTDTRLGLALIDLAEWCLRLNKYSEADVYYRRGIPIVQAMFPPAHLRVLQLMEDWGSVNLLQGRYEDAESVYKTLLTTVEKALGEQHPRVGAALRNLVALYETQGRMDEADIVRKRMLEVSNAPFRGKPSLPVQVQPRQRR